LNKIIVYGGYGELSGKQNRSFVTLQPIAKQMLDKDSMYLFADTIFSSGNATTGKKTVKAYYHARIYKTDLQAIADSLVYKGGDSLIMLYHEPVMWSGYNQITADTIVLAMNNNRLDSFYLRNNAFIASREGAREFNQVKGRNMKGYFADNKIRYMVVAGNGQSVYYVRDADSTYLGVNVTDCSEMEFYFTNNRMDKGSFITAPEAIMYNLKEVKPEELRLRGFKWLGRARPDVRLVKQRLKSR
jgi:hypothetical protein